ncbi:MAG: hypothetical protein Q9160_006010 [Pyrenula sp. 1 TL-2023]
MKQPPFLQENQLLSNLEADVKYPEPRKRFLPGHPQISVDDHGTLDRFLKQEFCSTDLDRINPWLWMMSMQSHTNISPLHRQRVKQRDITVTEDPKLHLVWFHDRIFIKPLPRYLLSFNFWNDHLPGPSNNQTLVLSTPRQTIRAAALGYLRNWCFLIKHESDFKIAQDHALQLIPADLTWAQFCAIRSRLHSIPNTSVSLRYYFGEIRLTRLNFYAKFVLHKRAYQRMNAQYGAYFAQFYAPILFVLGICSVLLNCMQVTLTAERAGDLERHWALFRDTCLWFSINCSILMVVLVLVLGLLFLYKFVAEWKRAIMDRWKMVADIERDANL